MPRLFLASDDLLLVDCAASMIVSLELEMRSKLLLILHFSVATLPIVLRYWQLQSYIAPIIRTPRISRIAHVSDSRSRCLCWRF
jgi:hypothetical protein